MSTSDCGCRFKAALGLLAMCDNHWKRLDAELAKDPQIIPALMRLVESQRSSP